MVFAVQAQVGFRNAARRDAVAQVVATRLAQDVPAGEVELISYISLKGDPSLVVTVRFNTLGEADAFWTDVGTAFGTGVNGPVTGSSRWRHDCPHDQGQGACVVSSRVDY